MNCRNLHRCMSARIADPMFTTFTSVMRMFTATPSAEALRGRTLTDGGLRDGERGERGEHRLRTPGGQEGGIQ
jgi:hypothetical protein